MLLIGVFAAGEAPAQTFDLGLEGAESSAEFALDLDDALPEVDRVFDVDRNEIDDRRRPPSRREATSRPSLVPAVEMPKPFPVRIKGDFVGLVKAPLTWDGGDWGRLGLGIAVVGAVALLDDQINASLDLRRTDAAVRSAEAIRPIGTEGGLLLMGATWLAGRSLERPEITAMAEDGLEAVLFSAGVITPLLKSLSGRERPRNTSDPSAFAGDGHSFPSGETTMVFAMASVVAAHSNRWWIDAGAWGVAGLIGLERMVLDAHWASDVVAGALIGAAVGRWVVRRNRPEFASRTRVNILPTFGAGEMGVQVNLRF